MIAWAEAAHEAEWRRLWTGFLNYYDMNLAPEITDFTWARLMDPSCPMKARMAFDGPRALGFAIHQHHPSTWVMGDDCYLEDLFVDPAARGGGAGGGVFIARRHAAQAGTGAGFQRPGDRGLDRPARSRTCHRPGAEDSAFELTPKAT